MRKKNYKPIIKRNITAWLLILPSILLFVFFVWLPIGKNVVLSFYNDYSMTKFVGLANYKDILLDDAVFLIALKNTFSYILWSILLGYFIPIIIGFLLSEVIHAKGFFRIAIYIPCMISGIAVSFLFLKLYGSENYSLLNILTMALGGDAKAWAGDSKIIIPLIVIAMTWRGAGGTALIYLSNFQTVDQSYYEASRIDGVGAFKRFFSITMPLMKSTLLTLLVLQIISVFQVFYEPLVIGSVGGPNNGSMSLMLLSYKYAVMDGNPSQGAAVSVILGVIIIIFTIAYFALEKVLNKGDK